MMQILILIFMYYGFKYTCRFISNFASATRDCTKYIYDSSKLQYRISVKRDDE